MKKTLLHYTDSILFDIGQAAKVAKLAAVQLFNKLQLELIPDEYAALDVISCHQDICQRDLAKIILKDRANTGRILDTLEVKNLVKRYVDTKNNRLVRKVQITEAGNVLLKKMNIKIQEHIDGLLAEKVSENEIESLQLSLRQFRQNVEKFLELNI